MQRCDDICNRLRRYTPRCIADRLDFDFSKAVQEAIEVISFMNSTITTDKIKDHALYTDEFGLLTEKKPEKHGFWYTEILEYTTNVCSECELESETKYNYCPRCGAKMDGDKNG